MTACRDAYAGIVTDDYDDCTNIEGWPNSLMEECRYSVSSFLRVWLPAGHHIPLPFILDRARVELAGPPVAADDIPLVDSPEEALCALAGICAGRYNPYVPAPGDLGRLLAIAAGLGDPAAEATLLAVSSRPDPVGCRDRDDWRPLTPPFGYRGFRHDGGLKEQLACYGLNSVIRPLYFRWALWRLRRLIVPGDQANPRGVREAGNDRPTDERRPLWPAGDCNRMDDDDYSTRPAGLRHWIGIHLRVWLPVGRRIPLKYLIAQARAELDSAMPAVRGTPPADSPWEALQALAGISAGRYNPYVPAPGDLGWLLAIATGRPAPTSRRPRYWSDVDPVKGEGRRDPQELVVPFGYLHPHGWRERWDAMTGYGLNAIRRPLTYRWALWRLRRMSGIPEPRRPRRTPHTPRWL